MSLGQVATILVCQNSSSGSPSTACPPGMSVVAVNAYVLDTTSQSYFDVQSGGFDYVQAAQFFGVSFISILGLWLVAKSVGMVIKTIR